ncbi:hypothetical protein BTN82_15015 [Pseudomonas chlororaphis]|uniref:Uncharacterized protein n=1 Tax=Pseudomonas chlororaphis TaxID=587753 RepID=A0A1Q8EPQ4_9PSED|nr:hypothetical protein BTN82_15015 [Pseudomonas chlororaphis]
MTDRIERLEAQVNALAQGWLRLAAALEVQGLVSPDGIDHALLSVRWPGQPIEAEATKTLTWLCDQLAEARCARRSAAPQAPSGWYGTAVK